MTKFYVLDLDVYGVDSWHTDKVEVEARSAVAAAENFAAKQDGFDHDGAQSHIAVARQADGDDAHEYVITLNIEERYDTRDGRDLTIPPPSVDADDVDAADAETSEDAT
jgi:uncharacterized membrane protein YdfJ with MMPL/SSD domain